MADDANKLEGEGGTPTMVGSVELTLTLTLTLSLTLAYP